ncbi:MAG TPA: sigma-70 family RNA polymerase sigma factor [Nitrospirales bacterium]|nr:sigma-70 family RNA polymerase sigma factor [Nitrospirales bacterium]
MKRDEILSRLRERLVAFVTSRLSAEMADDVSQEVLLLLHQKYPHVESLEELVPLSFQITRLKMLDLRRKGIRRGEHTRIPIEAMPLATSGPDPSEAAAHSERVERLGQALERLGERCRRIFQWKLEGKTFAEIQRLMDVSSINTIYTWDFRCRKELLQLMGGSWE